MRGVHRSKQEEHTLEGDEGRLGSFVTFRAFMSGLSRLLGEGDVVENG
jgi:hypothetical protein